MGGAEARHQGGGEGSQDERGSDHLEVQQTRIFEAELAARSHLAGGTNQHQLWQLLWQPRLCWGGGPELWAARERLRELRSEDQGEVQRLGAPAGPHGPQTVRGGE